MCEFQLSQSGNDLYSQSQFDKDDVPGPQQLDMFFIYDVHGKSLRFGDASSAYSDTQTAIPPASKPVSAPEVELLESDNWIIQELITSGSWSNINKLEVARESLHEEVFECSGLELGEVRKALKEVAARIRQLAN